MCITLHLTCMCIVYVHRFFDSTNYIVVKTAKQVDVLIAAINDRLDDNGRESGPLEYADDFREMYHKLGMQDKPEINIKQEADDVTITGKTFPLSLFLDEIGFEMSSGAFHPKDLLANFDTLIQDVKELANVYGWSVMHEHV